MEPGGSEPRDRTGKLCEAEPRATERPPETNCLPGLWQVKPDTWLWCLTSLAICKSVQQIDK